MTDLKITIAEAGERLYLHPVAYFPIGGTHLNRVHWFQPQEFPPYQSNFLHGFADEWCSTQHHLAYVWRQSLLRLLIASWRTLKFCWHFKRFELHWLSFHWDTSLPIVCAALFDGALSIHGQLQINDPDEWVDQSYLVPSQKYLKLRLAEWMERVAHDPENEYRQDQKQDYLKWAKRWEDQGCKIAFLCSLDT